MVIIKLTCVVIMVMGVDVFTVSAQGSGQTIDLLLNYYDYE